METASNESQTKQKNLAVDKLFDILVRDGSVDLRQPLCYAVFLLGGYAGVEAKCGKFPKDADSSKGTRSRSGWAEQLHVKGHLSR